MSRDSSEAAASGMSWLALFASTGTLICCALPILLVSLGMGAAVAAMTSAFPFLITLSQHKDLVFLLSGLLLAACGWSLYRPGHVCPAERAGGASCRRLRTWNRRVFWAALVLWNTGFFAAFLALPLRILLGW